MLIAEFRRYAFTLYRLLVTTSIIFNSFLATTLSNAAPDPLFIYALTGAPSTTMVPTSYYKRQIAPKFVTPWSPCAVDTNSWNGTYKGPVRDPRQCNPYPFLDRVTLGVIPPFSFPFTDPLA